MAVFSLCGKSFGMYFSESSQEGTQRHPEEKTDIDENQNINKDRTTSVQPIDSDTKGACKSVSEPQPDVLTEENIIAKMQENIASLVLKSNSERYQEIYKQCENNRQSIAKDETGSENIKIQMLHAKLLLEKLNELEKKIESGSF